MIILHEEYAIGIKKLSDAELGQKDGNLTHIGLSEKVFTFLPDNEIQIDGILVHDDGNPSLVQCSFAKISNKRSTLVKTTTSNPTRSVVKQIRNYLLV